MITITQDSVNSTSLRFQRFSTRVFADNQQPTSPFQLFESAAAPAVAADALNPACDPQAAQNTDGDGTGLVGDLSSLVQSLQGVDAPALVLSAVCTPLHIHLET